MRNYYVEVLNIKPDVLQCLAKQHALGPTMLLAAARHAGSIESCSHCGTTLQQMVDQYRHIPSKDLTIRIESTPRGAMIAQSASGGHECYTMKKILRQLQQEHLAARLEEMGYKVACFQG